MGHICPAGHERVKGVERFRQSREDYTDWADCLFACTWSTHHQQRCIYPTGLHKKAPQLTLTGKQRKLAMEPARSRICFKHRRQSMPKGYKVPKSAGYPSLGRTLLRWGWRCVLVHFSLMVDTEPVSIWHPEDRASWYILIIKSTRCTNFSYLFLE